MERPVIQKTFQQKKMLPLYRGTRPLFTPVKGGDARVGGTLYLAVFGHFYYEVLFIERNE